MVGIETANHLGVAAVDFSTVSGCHQFFVCQTHARGGTLDLLMTDVLDLAWFVVVTPIGNSDHSSLSVVISMAQAVLNLCVSWKVLVGIQFVVQYRICPGVAFGNICLCNVTSVPAGWTLCTIQGCPCAQQG